jgi:hypothetical protein
MRHLPILHLVAGAIVAAVWLLLEASLISVLPLASTPMEWRSIQALAGGLGAFILVTPMVLVLRPTSIRFGVYFTAGFLAAIPLLHLSGGGTPATLAALLQLPDIWAMLLVSLGLYWLASSRNVTQRAA